MDISTMAAFAAVTFIAVVTPGPDVILAMANGSRFGMKKAVAGMIGVLLSDFFLIAAVAAGPAPSLPRRSSGSRSSNIRVPAISPGSATRCFGPVEPRKRKRKAPKTAISFARNPRSRSAATA